MTSQKTANKPTKNAESGYSLITTAIAIVGIGFIFSALTTIYMIYQSKERSIVSSDHIAETRAALEHYISLNNKLPCPAPIDVSIDSPEMGVAVGGAGGCNGVGTYSGIAETTGRDGMRVLIGAVPTRTINLPDSAGIDGWSKRLVYAVTTNYTTDTANFSEDNGAITLKDGDKPDGTPNHVTASGGTAIYVILAPGSDDRGAYSMHGELIEPCADDTFAGENCSLDNATFNLSMNRSFNVNDDTYTNTFFYRASAAIYKWDIAYGACNCHAPPNFSKVRLATITCRDSQERIVSDSFCTGQRPSDAPQDCSAETSLVGNCFGWNTPNWGRCPCDSTISRTSTCNKRDGNNGALLTGGNNASQVVDNNQCALVVNNAPLSGDAVDPINCAREGDIEPQPNPQTRSCRSCPPPTPTPAAGGTCIGCSCPGACTEESDPLVIDLNGDGEIELSNEIDGVQFDIDDDGAKDQTAWVGCNDGLLFIDENGDGIVTNHSELFGNDELAAFEELGLHDSNGNGKIDAGDDNYERIQVWQDVNSDGLSQASEMSSLTEHSIVTINIAHDELNDEISGNDVTGESSFERMIDGIIHKISATIEVFLKYIKG